MVRRAFGGKFSDTEIEDIYANAWVGTLRALRNRPALAEPELRKYVLTAVANHASKELRRRGRRPTSPLDSAPEVVDHQATPDERVAIQEQIQITREILATLPQRRRAVLMFRYAWGLKPEEVCNLVEGLSHRAYRKEITKGVNEIVEKFKLVEQGRWCTDREPLIKAFASGLADGEERRQAEQHLAHCRPCARFAGELGSRLHEIGSAIALTSTAGSIAGASLYDRLAGVVDRAREILSSARESTEQVVTQLIASGGSRGAGAAGAGALAKVGFFSGGPQLAAVCLGTGVAATACVAAGVVPGVKFPGSEDKPASVQREAVRDSGRNAEGVKPPEVLPSQLDAGHSSSTPDPAGSGPDPQPAPAPPPPAPAQEPAPAPAPAPPAPTEFEPPPAPEPAPPPGGGGSPPSGSEAAQEFGP